MDALAVPLLDSHISNVECSHTTPALLNAVPKRDGNAGLYKNYRGTASPVRLCVYKRQLKEPMLIQTK